MCGAPGRGIKAGRIFAGISGRLAGILRKPGAAGTEQNK